MKFSLIVFVLLFTTNVYAQKISKDELNELTLDNFQINDCKIRWIKVFYIGFDSESIQTMLLSKNISNITIVNDSTLIGQIDKASLIGTKCSYKDFAADPISYKIKIDIKEGKYRVTVSDVCFHSKISNSILTLEWYGLNKECKFKSIYGFTKYLGKILECYFTDTFTITENDKTNNW